MLLFELFLRILVYTKTEIVFFAFAQPVSTLNDKKQLPSLTESLDNREKLHPASREPYGKRRPKSRASKLTHVRKENKRISDKFRCYLPVSSQRISLLKKIPLG